MNPTRYTKLHHRSVHPSIRLDFPSLICFTETATFSSSGLIFLVWYETASFSFSHLHTTGNRPYPPEIAQEGHLLRSATASEIYEIEFEGREDEPSSPSSPSTICTFFTFFDLHLLHLLRSAGIYTQVRHQATYRPTDSNYIRIRKKDESCTWENTFRSSQTMDKDNMLEWDDCLEMTI
ncbi:hypothetical protein L2E82_23022 [Cichorium intybus]|uniref:Uncharacterized protein n=1 Tax=Cichorium intybus TaxID=13427 RepID=A0ACB9DYZ2_CICIN|nr:hypothetical protein L2E82_23022 [Cichorium intybus]